jgi:hypothetical protein
MRKRTILTTAAVLAVGALVVPTYANAANGGAWLLGKSNYESVKTTVTNNYGTALSLNSKSGYAPFTVNRTTKVTNLNADLLDGVTASSFARTTAKTGIVKHDGTLDGVGAKCPTGTVSTGGGGFDPYGWEIGYSGPDWNVTTDALIPNSWIVLDVDGWVLNSYVNCMSMTGAAIPGAMTASDYVSSSPFSASLSADGAEQERTKTAHSTGK